MNAFGLNGTWLPYHAPLGLEPSLNPHLLTQVSRCGFREIVICSNQGEIPYGRELAEQGRPSTFPTVENLAADLAFVQCALADTRIRVSSFHISLYHPAIVRSVWIGHCCAELASICSAAGLQVVCYPSTWKPQPMILERAFASCLWGANPHDAEAARAASIPYRPVSRFEMESGIPYHR